MDGASAGGAARGGRAGRAALGAWVGRGLAGFVPGFVAARGVRVAGPEAGGAEAGGAATAPAGATSAIGSSRSWACTSLATIPTATAPSSSAGIAVANAPTALAARARRRGSEPTCSGGAVTSAETTRTRGGGCRRGASLNRSRASLARSGSTSTSSGLSTKSGSGRFTESIGSLSSIDIDFLARGRMVDVASDKTRRSSRSLSNDRHTPEGTYVPRRSRAVSVSPRGAPGDRECRDAPAPPEHLVRDRRLRGGAALPLRRAPDIAVGTKGRPAPQTPRPSE